MNEALRPLAIIFQLGVQIITPIMMCLFLGMFLDRNSDSHFWTLILIILGVLAGFRNLLVSVLRMSAPKKSDTDSADKEK